MIDVVVYYEEIYTRTGRKKRNFLPFLLCIGGEL
jgi:hypothetical protein